MTVDKAGNLYIADTPNHVIRRVSAADGTISTVVGKGGVAGLGGDGGPVELALLSLPVDVSFDGAGNLYIADRGNMRVRKVTYDSAGNGTITTIVGGGAIPAPSAEGKPATLVFMGGDELYGLDVNESGDIYFTFVGGSNGRLIKVAASGDKAGLITTLPSGPGHFTDVAVTGTGATESVFIAKASDLLRLNVATGTLNTIAPGYWPRGVTVDPSSPTDVYFTAAGANSAKPQVWRIGADGSNPVVVAGDGQVGFSGDGRTAVSARLDNPGGITIGPDGRIFFSDSDNSVVRMVTSEDLPRSADLSLTVAADPPMAEVGETITYTAVATNRGPDPAHDVVIEFTIPVASGSIQSATASRGDAIPSPGLMSPVAPPPLPTTRPSP
ncbi:MAG TPA: hypothetical protein VM142_06215 [Acidimicrobiales bacterium]|nr:hypothetical protein [Acidimicrobiales bacterium]